MLVVLDHDIVGVKRILLRSHSRQGSKHDSVLELQVSDRPWREERAGGAGSGGGGGHCVCWYANLELGTKDGLSGGTSRFLYLPSRTSASLKS